MLKKVRTMSSLNLNNVIKVPVKTYGSLYRAWLEYLTPMHKMNNRAKDLAACFLKERDRLSKSISDDKLLNNVLMSSDTKNQIKKECELSASFFDVLMKHLRKAGFIVDGAINPMYVPKKVPAEGYFNVMLLFDLNEGK